MSIGLISKIAPLNNGSFPVFEDVDGLGGFQVRDDLSGRNSIPTLNRKEGMIVYVKSDGKFYQLDNGLTNAHWSLANFNAYNTYPIILSSNYAINSSLHYNFYKIDSSQLFGAITNAIGTPIVITSNSHNLITGDSVQISGVLGNTNANGNYKVTVIDSNNFSLNNSATNSTYTSGGTFYKIENFNITLPLSTSVPDGTFYSFKDVVGNCSRKSVNFLTSGTEKIDSVISNSNTLTNLILDKDYQSITVVSNGSDGWYVLSNYYSESKSIIVDSRYNIPPTTQKHLIYCDTSSILPYQVNISLPKLNSRPSGSMDITIKDISFNASNNSINIISFGVDSIEGVNSNYLTPYQIQANGGSIRLINYWAGSELTWTWVLV